MEYDLFILVKVDVEIINLNKKKREFRKKKVIRELAIKIISLI